MKRFVIVASLAIGLLFGASVIVLFLITGPPPSSGSASVTLAAAVTSTGTRPAPAVESAPPGAPRASSVTGHVGKSAFLGGPASSTPAAGRVTRKLVRKALLAAPIQSRLARCVDQVGGFGGRPEVRPAPRGAPAVLMLEMEGLGGELRIVDAPVHSWGEASEAAVSCARSVLRGQVIPAPKVGRGERLSMPFPLNPRAETIAASR